jgi:hypothetical protein
MRTLNTDYDRFFKDSLHLTAPVPPGRPASQMIDANGALIKEGRDCLDVMGAGWTFRPITGTLAGLRPSGPHPGQHVKDHRPDVRPAIHETFPLARDMIH